MDIEIAVYQRWMGRELTPFTVRTQKRRYQFPELHEYRETLNSNRHRQLLFRKRARQGQKSGGCDDDDSDDDDDDDDDDDGGDCDGV